MNEDSERRRAGNESLSMARKAKNDEFYTQYVDVEKEMNSYLDYDENVFREKTVLLPCDDPEWSNFTKYFAQNFERLGLKKLVSTSYAIESKKFKNSDWQPTLFERNAPWFDIDKAKLKGKIFVLERSDIGTSLNRRIDLGDLLWKYLEGDGDFRSEEVTRLRDEADIIVTNPPFSLFREFLAWIMAGKKKFSIIGNMNAITYKGVFPLIKDNKIWLGHMGAMTFRKPDGVESFAKLGNVCWFTNIDHGRRHEPLSLMTMVDNLKFPKHQEIKENGYQKYDNYDAIEVPYSDAIPSDYDGVMGVPITFMDKYNPEQFELIGATESEGKGFSCGLWKGSIAQGLIHGERVYKRLFIKLRKRN